MVYQGKPSAGCANCRKRKIKCDEGLPACSQCTNTKRTCPGYIARFDLILRDQTKAVRRKAQRKRQQDNQTKSASAAISPLPFAQSTFKTYHFPRSSSPPSSVSSEESSSPYYALAGPGEGPSYAVIKRSNSDTATVPRMFNDFPEQQAICAFFLDFVLLPRHPDSIRGHLEHLLPLYTNSGPDSPLALATSSIALSMSGNSQTRAADHQLARTIFGRALRKTSTAIRDPVDSLKDSTLMAVLLLGLFERINAASEATAKTHINMTSTHNAGAAALVKHRGRGNCASPTAIGLLFATRTQLVEHSIEEGLAFKRCPDGLSAIFKDLPQNAAARLTSATINIADLRSCAKSALLLPRSPAADQEVNDLLEYAISIDLLVAAWAEAVPENWRWQRGTHFDLPAAFDQSGSTNVPWSAFQYLDKRDIYLDLWVLSIWNQYRSARIKIQSIILACIHYLGADYEAQWYWRGVYAKMIAQEMSDEICASVPFALGTKTLGGPGDREGVEFPFVPEKGKQGEEHRRAACALGGWHLLAPLRTVVKCREESKADDAIRPGEEEWALGQMERVGRIYALQGGKGLEVRGEHMRGNNVWGEAFF